jgi:hypothetical protein
VGAGLPVGFDLNRTACAGLLDDVPGMAVTE